MMRLDYRDFFRVTTTDWLTLGRPDPLSSGEKLLKILQSYEYLPKHDQEPCAPLIEEMLNPERTPEALAADFFLILENVMRDSLSGLSVWSNFLDSLSSVLASNPRAVAIADDFLTKSAMRLITTGDSPHHREILRRLLYSKLFFSPGALKSALIFIVHTLSTGFLESFFVMTNVYIRFKSLEREEILRNLRKGAETEVLLRPHLRALITEETIQACRRSDVFLIRERRESLDLFFNAFKAPEIKSSSLPQIDQMIWDSVPGQSEEDRLELEFLMKELISPERNLGDIERDINQLTAGVIRRGFAVRNYVKLFSALSQGLSNEKEIKKIFVRSFNGEELESLSRYLEPFQPRKEKVVAESAGFSAENLFRQTGWVPERANPTTLFVFGDPDPSESH